MKLAQFFGKNQLDEMQERTMLTIESRGFWLVWSLLLVVLLGEGLLGFTMREMAGTWAVFMIGVFVFIKMSAYDAPLSIMLVGASIAAGTTFVLALVVLQLCSAVYKKRHEQLENEFDKEEKDD